MIIITFMIIISLMINVNTLFKNEKEYFSCFDHAFLLFDMILPVTVTVRVQYFKGYECKISKTTAYLT